MSFKTVVVHLANEQRAHRMLSVAVEIAERFEAHLIGLHVFPHVRLTPPIPLPFGGEIAAQIRGSIKKEDEAIRAVFEAATASRPFTSEWRSITQDARDPGTIVLHHARGADLVITSQSDPNWQFSDILDFPERIALGAGRPVLVVPTIGHPVGVPRNISVAWADRREASRAVADALPFLKIASRVHLMTVDESGRPAAEDGLGDIEKSLVRHGVRPVVARLVPTEYTLGEEVRVRAIEENADMLVMGCYGHSRLREMALGGVTRHILREMTMPVLLSH